MLQKFLKNKCMKKFLVDLYKRSFSVNCKKYIKIKATIQLKEAN